MYTIKDIFSISTLYWFGLDFANSRLIGSMGFTNPHDIRTRIVAGWNGVILTEPNKFDLRKAFNKQVVNYDQTVALDISRIPDPATWIINMEYVLDSATIPLMISNYNITSVSEGIGVVFIVESFNKFTKMASVFVTFFDIASKTALLTVKMSGTAGGFGLRNYWANAINDILLQIGKTNYRSWQAKYG